MMRLYLLFLITICAIKGHAQLCYYNRVDDAERGYIGKIDSVKLYYELWVRGGPAGTETDIVILRTDTADITNSVDFCIDEDDDSITVYRKVDNVEQENFRTTDARAIPTIFQILPKESGYCQMSGFNRPGSNCRLYIKGNKLFLTYPILPRYGQAFSEQKIYQLKNGIFELINSTGKPLK